MFLVIAIVDIYIYIYNRLLLAKQCHKRAIKKMMLGIWNPTNM